MKKNTIVVTVTLLFLFKVAMGTRLLYCKGFNNFESSIILQFVKSYTPVLATL